MKKSTARVFAIVFAFVVLVSLASITVSANNVDTIFSVSTTGSTYSAHRIDPPREKENATAVYLYITSSLYTHTYVQACRCTEGLENVTNYTLVNGSYAGQVVCREGVKYSVHNSIYEDGGRWATIGFKCLSATASDTIRGVWSPDSANSYTDAT